MNYEKLADLLFPDVTMTPEEVEEKYPPRILPEGAKVTRFAPSPTGFVHFGGMYQAMIDERLAHQSGGVFCLRIEDTDAKREVKGAVEQLIETLARYGIQFDEGASEDVSGEIWDKGMYGPYKQSQRAWIYHVYAKKLVSEGKAYPVFTDKEELEAALSVDKKTVNKTKDWKAEAQESREAMLRQREFTMEEVEENLARQNPFVLRILSNGDPDNKTPFVDLVKGKLEVPENDEDFVLLKSDGIPTYHFAHAVDDHLMGTTHVIRGEEWLPSLPKHIQLFRYLGFRMPKYLHTAQIMRLDEEGNKKKLSKRDMGAKMEDYDEIGYPLVCILEYLMTLLNSNYEEWHAANPDKSYREFPFSIKKMSVSGCLFDFNKLNDVSKNMISRMTSEEVYDGTLAWSRKYDPAFADLLEANPSYAKAIFSIGRGGKKPRKDFAAWNEVKHYMGFFYDEYFRQEDDYPSAFPPSLIADVLERYLDVYDPTDDNAAWFGRIKALAEEFGFASDMKLYKADPSKYRGSVADVSMFLRVALTGKMNSPDMYAVSVILGETKVKNRLLRMIHFLNQMQN